MTARTTGPGRHGERVLAVLQEAQPDVVSYATLLRAAWGPTYENDLPNRKLLHGVVSHLRDELAGSSAHIINERGIGYRFTTWETP